VSRAYNLRHEHANVNLQMYADTEYKTKLQNHVGVKLINEFQQ